ncbi:NUDIX domain-containing protein [Streptomycetaceae bacterium NBC_01309]
MAAPPVREAARVIVLDTLDNPPDDARVLLLRYDENGGFWATPGGSLEPGETPQAAAARELHEELGVTDAEIGPAVAVRTKDHLVGGAPVRQTETYYIAVVTAERVDPANAHQTDNIRAWRWWKVTDIAHTEETVYPVGLATVVAAYLGNGGPSQPTELTD